MVVIARDEDEPYVAGDEGVGNRRDGPALETASLPTPRRYSRPRRRRYSRAHLPCPRAACGPARRLQRRGAWPAWRAALRLPPFTPRLEPARGRSLTVHYGCLRATEALGPAPSVRLTRPWRGFPLGAGLGDPHSTLQISSWQKPTNGGRPLAAEPRLPHRSRPGTHTRSIRAHLRAAQFSPPRPLWFCIADMQSRGSLKRLSRWTLRLGSKLRSSINNPPACDGFYMEEKRA